MKRIKVIWLSFCVMWLLLSCGADKGEMLHQLELLEVMNRTDSVMRNDTLAESLVEYFDKHGTPNERMRSRYILGRTYFDLGELPRALESYLEAASSADTTAYDCDYKTLARIHAQSANVFNLQIQPRSQLKELRQAEYYAVKGKDSLMAIECYFQQTGPYLILHMYDSVVSIAETAARMYLDIGLPDRSATKLGAAISSLLHKGDVRKARLFINKYEMQSGLFDEKGNIESGREVYYYTKGEYYLSVDKIDSAEFFFRKELHHGHDLNNQIAGYKGLLDVYLKKGISDSIAKFSKIAYELNDSAYSLSEMQNIQKMQMSYNYEYNKQLAVRKGYEADRANNRLIIAVAVVIILLLLIFIVFLHYRKKNAMLLQQYKYDVENLALAQTELTALREEKEISKSIVANKSEQIIILQNRVIEYQKKLADSRGTDLENRLRESPVVKHLCDIANANPPLRASIADNKSLKALINDYIPEFYSIVNDGTCALTELEYQVCMLIRVHFSPSEICKLTGISDGYVSNIRKRLLKKVFHIEGAPKEFDRKILEIR